MSVFQETSFIRGRKRSNETKSTTSKIKKYDNNNLFSKKPKKPKQKRKNVEETATTHLTDSDFYSNLKLKGTLTKDKISEGMIILGCIKRIQTVYLQVELPGNMYARISVNGISDAFARKMSSDLNKSCTKAQNPLQDFTIGQFLPVGIESIHNTESGFVNEGTINPRFINSLRAHKSLSNDCLIWVSISSEHDHGYVLDCGIENCKAFLPFDNIDNSKNYSIGVPFYCVIKTCKHSTNSTIITVSTKEIDFQKCATKELNGLNDVLPGMPIKFIVSKITPSGIRGYFHNKFYGYVDQSQLLDKHSNISVESEMTVYVLFTEKLTNVTYLTLKKPCQSKGQKLPIGTTELATVSALLPRGMYLKMKETYTGFVTYKRLLNCMNKNSDINFEKISSMYPNGSTHKCRILDYSPMQNLYICTTEANVIKQVLSSADLKIAQIVMIRVVNIKDGGLVVKVDSLQGFVPNLHITDSMFTENIKQKFKIGRSYKSRVWDIQSNGNVIFTLKARLIQTNSCLTDISNSIINSSFDGVVVHIEETGILVAFFDDITGWLPKENMQMDISIDKDENQTQPIKQFYFGQVITVYILSVKENDIKLCLFPPHELKQHAMRKKAKNELKVTDVLSVSVTAIGQSNIDVEILPHKIPAIIPINHLSCCLSLCSLISETISVGSTIDNLVCVKYESKPILSLREYYFGKKEVMVTLFDDLREGMIIGSSFLRKTNDGIFVYLCLSDFNDDVFIRNENIDDNIDFVPHESIKVKILKMNIATRQIDLSAKKMFTQNNNMNVALDLLEIYLDDINVLIDFGKANKWSLVEFCPGEKVTGIVEKIIAQKGIILKLVNGVKGFIPNHLRSGNEKKNDKVECIVLVHDFVDEQLIVCTNPRLKHAINSQQDGILQTAFDTSGIAEFILYTNYFGLAVLKGDKFNRQLLYLPLVYDQLGINKVLYDTTGHRFKIFVNRLTHKMVIGVSKRFLIPNIGSYIVQKKHSHENVSTYSMILQKTKTRKRSKSTHCLEEKQIDDTNQSQSLASSETKNSNDENTVSVHNAKKDNLVPIFGDMTTFYDEMVHSTRQASSSDEEDDETSVQKRKKKLTAFERAELSRKEENRVSTIEKELLDSVDNPQSANHFERLLLAHPNDSQLWLKYISLHLSASDLDKARVVAKKALESVNAVNTKDKFNIWVALLNMENMYGTKESFEKVYEDALRFNEPLDVHLAALDILADSGKLTEMNEKIKKVKTKERHSVKMWIEVGKLYYRLKMLQEARRFKEAALQSITEKKYQFDIIIRFAIMEFQFGDFQQATLNFEAIVAMFPSKINIWTIYVDQLAKLKKIDKARHVLLRVTQQKFTPKNMKSIFAKFVAFEEKFGNADTVKDVTQKAQNYIKKISC